MRTIGNILWHIPFLGFLNALCAFLFGALLTVTVVAAPIGLGLMQYAKFLLLPFSYCMVRKKDLDAAQNPLWKTYSVIIMILYLPFGLLAVLIAIIQIIGLCLTIIGIPAALVIAKSLETYLNPVGKVCVPLNVAEEIMRRKAAESLTQFSKTS